MAKRKPKIGDRVSWHAAEGGEVEYGKVVGVLGSRVEVRWDNPPEFYEADDTFSYDLMNAASGVRLCQ